ncbi:hypothetical protein BpHYR1_043957 [Brachionus plicatilis]|uniref:Uncharacterized protein n=1 Tax=Brachionus plicatilis TaxID=10195 RepID=A0A3M7Q0W6_BRAPC|nr:hypothetical protein BpHYR1_043957 [Brachionus plicatilis]
MSQSPKVYFSEHSDVLVILTNCESFDPKFSFIPVTYQSFKKYKKEQGLKKILKKYKKYNKHINFMFSLTLPQKLQTFLFFSEVQLVPTILIQPISIELVFTTIIK